MALDVNATKLANLVDPEVMADLFEKKLIDALKFAPVAEVDSTLVGRPGDTITVPSYSYIGTASVVAEGSDITINQLTQTTTKVTIHKVGNGIQITDEAVLSGYGDPIGEGTRQLAISIADKIDNELLGALGTATLTHTAAGATVTADDIAVALTKFGEDIDGVKAVFVDATTYAGLRRSTTWMPASDIAAEILLRGAVGQVQGCQVIVTDRIKDGTVYIVKPGALALYLKRDTLIEADRDIVNKTTVVTADKHEAVALRDASKAIKVNVAGTTMSITPTTLTIAKGGTGTITVSDPEDTITVTSSAEDVTTSVSNNTITVSVAADATSESATITVTDGTTTKTCAVTVTSE